MSQRKCLQSGADRLRGHSRLLCRHRRVEDARHFSSSLATASWPFAVAACSRVMEKI